MAEFPWKQHERVGSFFLDIVLMSPPHQHMAALLLQFTEVYAARNVSERWRSLIRRKHGFSWLTWSFRDGCFQRDGRALFFPFALLRFSRLCCLYLPAGLGGGGSWARPPLSLGGSLRWRRLRLLCPFQPYWEGGAGCGRPASLPQGLSVARGERGDAGGRGYPAGCEH